ncbi:YdgA family protein [Rhizobium sp. P40RR-XXII]|uniref:YdgA family protein n=1 Tax=unclassified Rhizobium TaxID=2613769 RepID=UPI0014566225|nr:MULTISPECIES: YdgA family protein [unclassified Rhizobium]NLR87902.1 YdgA family protein [Rhizobium sp. P28RR-XV]NLS19593.1 YdgA family protein [Rhizobium sp. P40RR-XXII]
MRFKAIAAATVVAAGVIGSAQAADVSEQGAKDLYGNLTYFLPDDIAKSGAISVKPAGANYEVTYDLQKLLDKLNMSGFDISGLKPLLMLATPLDSGLWNIEGNNALDVTARSKPGSSLNSEFRYALASSTFKGVFDPALHYLRSMDMKGQGITLATKTTDENNGVQKNDATADSIVYTLSSADSGEAGRLDIKMNGSLRALYNKISADDATLGEIKIAAIDFNMGATKLPLKAVNSLLQFISEHKDEKTLSDKDGEALKALVMNAMPIVGSFDESVAINDIAVTTPFGNGGLQKMGYSFKVAGPANAMNADFGLNAEKLTLATGLVPEDYIAFIPNAADIQVQVPNLNFTAMMNVLKDTDFKKPGNDKAIDEKLQKAMFPDGTMTINFPKISAVSGLYDVQASGSMRGWLAEKDRVAMKMTVLARDLDKTIAAIQEAAKTKADLSQVSLGLMMAKGFAKTDADGRSRWDIDLSDDGHVSVNGQVVK